MLPASPNHRRFDRNQHSRLEGKTLPPPPTPPVDTAGSSTHEDAFIPPSGPHGRPTIQTAPLVPIKDTIDSPIVDAYSRPILLSGLSFPPEAFRTLLHRFDTYLTTTPPSYFDASVDGSSKSNVALASRQRTTILGTYEKTFSGDEVVEWLLENVEGFGGDWDKSVEAATVLTKKGYISRVGVGRGFDPDYDTYFILKENPQQISSIASPLSPSTSANIQSMLKSYLPSSLSLSEEPTHLKARREAVKADEAYKVGIRNVEERRLEMEERIERGLRVWERWERERLTVIKAGQQCYE